MMQYQYSVNVVYDTARRDEKLKEMGLDGWELCAVTETDLGTAFTSGIGKHKVTKFTMYFKMPAIVDDGRPRLL